MQTELIDCTVVSYANPDICILKLLCVVFLYIITYFNKKINIIQFRYINYDNNLSRIVIITKRLPPFPQTTAVQTVTCVELSRKVWILPGGCGMLRVGGDNMRKAIVIAVAALLLTACSSMAEKEKPQVASAETTTTTTQSTTTTALHTTSTTQATTTSSSSSARVESTTTTHSTTQLSTTTAKPTATTSTTKASNTTIKKTVQTTATATKQTTSTSKAVQTSASIASKKVVWSDLMLAWRHISERKNITQAEQELIRNDILNYGLKKFNGKTKIHCHVGNDNFDIAYLKPIRMTVQGELTDWTQHAHLDASVDTDSLALINYAKTEQEIYDIVAWTRSDSLRLIDFGLYSRYELSTMYGDLEYASDIHFNVGFDGTYIWFLNEDYYL